MTDARNALADALALEVTDSNGDEVAEDSLHELRKAVEQYLARPLPGTREEVARIIDADAWVAIEDGRDKIVGSLWANRRLWALQKADAILALPPAPMPERDEK